MIDLKTVFPRASQSFLGANQQNDVQPIVDAPRAKPEALRGRMNKIEGEFAMILEAMKRKGEILRYEYEGMTLRWFDMRYTPDFVVLYRDIAGFQSRMKFIEVKGPHIHYSQQAMARFKGARGFWPEFQFEMWQKKKGQWTQLF